jgi:hypothetical protein
MHRRGRPARGGSQPRHLARSGWSPDGADRLLARRLQRSSCGLRADDSPLPCGTLPRLSIPRGNPASCAPSRRGPMQTPARRSRAPPGNRRTAARCDRARAHRCRRRTAARRLARLDHAGRGGIAGRRVAARRDGPRRALLPGRSLRRALIGAPAGACRAASERQRQHPVTYPHTTSRAEGGRVARMCARPHDDRPASSVAA